VSEGRRRRLGAALLLLVAPAGARAEGTSSVRVETGADWDTNATREETGGAADGLLRTVGELQGSTPWGSGARLTAGWHGGGKLHMQRSGEDVLHQKADLSLAQALGGVLVLRWDAGARDRTSRAPVQSMDHTRLTTGPGVEARYAGWRIGLRGLYDRTVFKPDPAFDADALGAHASLGWGQDAFSVQVTGLGTRRTFKGEPLKPVGHVEGLPIVQPIADRHRIDDFRRAGFEVQYGGDFLVGGEIAWERNDSNSLGGSLTRHAARVQATVGLPFSLLLTCAATAQRLVHDDPQYISDTELIEDEGRSSVSARLERPLSEHWSLLAHGGTWFSPTATEGRYVRTVAGLGLGYGLEP
jgi:hypothetical protein